MNRNDLILAGCNKVDPIVEIGPSHSPIAPKRDGWQTLVVDHASQEDLRTKYGQFPGVAIDRIEVVDRIWQGGPLDALFQPPLLGGVQRVISSHAIEHLPDPVGFLVAASRLTHPKTGTVCLAVPDKRQCFDVFRPLTSTGDWLDAWREKRGRHNGASVFDHLAYEAQVDDAPWWPDPTGAHPRLMRGLSQAFEVYRDYEDGGRREYLDVHGWVFTPASFELLILELWLLGIIDWEVQSCQTTASHEFVVLLRRATQARTAAVAEQNERRHQLLLRVAGEAAQTLARRTASAEPAEPAELRQLRALDAGQSVVLDFLQQANREMAALRQDVAAMRGTQHDLQRLVNLLRRVRARWPTWLGGTRSSQPAAQPAPAPLPRDRLMAALGDEVVANCCAHLSVLDGGLGLFRLIHLIHAVDQLPQPPQRLYSIGSGAGYHEAILARLFPAAAVFAIDVEERHPRYPQPNLKSLQRDILLPAGLDDLGRADFVFSIECLEHIEQDEAAFAAMAGLVQDGGHLYLEVPYANETERQDVQLREHEWKHFGHHTPGYDHGQLSALSRANGLAIIEQGNVFWGPLQSMVWAGSEKFDEHTMRLWMAPLITLLRSDVRPDLAQGRHQALGIKVLARR